MHPKILGTVAGILLWASGGSARAQEITATQEDEKTIRVVAPGRFETTFTTRKGFGSTWFDLKHDPQKKRNLAPVADENGFFWVKIGKSGDTTGGSWYANPVEEMKLLESGPARVRVRLRGTHARYGQTDPKAHWTGFRFDFVHTVYPTGAVYVAYTLEQPEPLTYRHFLLITKSTGHWGPRGKGEGRDEVRPAGEFGAERPQGNKNSAFTLQWADGPVHFADILMVMNKGRFKGSYWAEGYLDQDYRTSFDIGDLFPERTLPAGRVCIPVLMRIADDMNSEKDAALYAEDYRAPDALAVSQGAADKADEGDRDGDGFNEEEGVYVLKRGAGGVAFTLHGAKTPRMDPAFKVKGWTSAAPERITLKGQEWKEFNASVHNGVLLVQLRGAVREDVTVAIGSKE